MKGKTFNVLIQLATEKLVSKNVISGAMMLTDSIETIAKNNKNSFPLRGNFMWYSIDINSSISIICNKKTAPSN
jgi:hypothetical protein